MVQNVTIRVSFLFLFMVHFYNLAIGILRLVFWAGSFVNSKASLFIKGRKNIFKNIKSAFIDNTSPIIWVHCASLGEFEQGRPVMEKLKREFQSHKILLTFCSPSGVEVRRSYGQGVGIGYLAWGAHTSGVKVFAGGGGVVGRGAAGRS